MGRAPPSCEGCGKEAVVGQVLRVRDRMTTGVGMFHEECKPANPFTEVRNDRQIFDPDSDEWIHIKFVWRFALSLALEILEKNYQDSRGSTVHSPWEQAEYEIKRLREYSEEGDRKRDA